MEHIERAGVHSGDSMAIYPPIKLTKTEMDTIVDYSVRIGIALGIKGLMNIQFDVVRDGSGKSKIYVLEVNPRASRTVPFISKVTGVPIVDIATRVMLGQSLKEQGYQSGLFPSKKLIAIKAPVFSMSKLLGVDTYLGPEMKSTGEVMGIDTTFNGALVKALMAAGLMLPGKGSMLFSIADRDKAEALPIIKDFYSAGYKLYATEGTSELLHNAGLAVSMISKKLGEGHPNIVDIIEDGTVNGVVNTITGGRVPLRDGFHIRRAAAERRIPCFTSLDTARAVAEVITNGQYSYNVLSMPEYRNR
jgi:carbamoyl-phosphate synthase large subunit